MPLTYRRATRSDLAFMVGLIAEDFVGPAPDDAADAEAPEYVAALDAIAADPRNELYIAELDGRSVGTLQLTFLPGIMRRGMWRGLIERVHIIPSERNKGFGGEMLRWAAGRCREMGCGMVQLTSNKARVDAHRFYRKLGYEQSHEGFKLYL